MNNKFKRLLAVLFSLSMVFCLMSANAWATQGGAEKVAKNTTSGVEYDTLADAVAAAGMEQNGNTIELLQDVKLAEHVIIAKDVTLDLGGHTLSSTYKGPKDKEWELVRAIQVDAGNVTITNGTVKGRVSCYDTATLTIAPDATVDGTVIVWGDGTYGEDGCKTPELNVYGTILGDNYQAISTNGTDNSGAKINIYEGATVSGKGLGIYQPSGNVTVSGGTITGTVSGIEVRKGTVKVTGGTITGNGTELKVCPNGSGSTTEGAGIVISQHTTRKDINVSISGGNISGHVAVLAVNPQGNPEGEGTLELNITGGTFTGAASSVAAVNADDRVVVTMTGGTYSSDPSANTGTLTYTKYNSDDDLENNTNPQEMTVQLSNLVANGYAAVKNNNGTWTVKKPSAYGFFLGYRPTNGATANGNIGDDNGETVYVGDKITLPREGEEVTIGVDHNRNDDKILIKRDGCKLTGWKLRKDNAVYAPGAQFVIPATFTVKNIAENNGDDQIFVAQWSIAAPAVPTVAAGYDSITVTALEGVEYSIDGGKTWVSGDAAKFEGLNPETQYTITARKVLADDTGVIRNTSSIAVKTSAAPAANKEEVIVATTTTGTATTNGNGIVADNAANAKNDDTITLTEAKEIAQNTSVEGLEDTSTVQNIVNSNDTNGADTHTVVVPSIDVTTKDFSKDADGTKTLTLDIKATYTVYETSDQKVKTAAAAAASAAASATTGDGKTTVKDTRPLNTEGTDVTVKIKLPDGFAKEGEYIYIKHEHSDNQIYRYKVKVYKEGSNLYVKFTNNKGFSPFELSTSDGALVHIGADPTTMQQAVDTVIATSTDLIINVSTATDLATTTDLNGNAELTATVSKEATIKIKYDTKQDDKVLETLKKLVTPGSGLELTSATASNTGLYTLVFKTKSAPTTPTTPGGGGTPGSGGSVTPTPTKAAAPAQPVIKEVTDKSIVVNAVAGVEYSIDGGKTWKSAKTGETTVTFDGLTPETEYTVSARVAKTEKLEASDIVTVKATTKKTEQPATGTDTPEPEPTPITPTPTNPTYDSLSSKEKKNAKAVAKALGVDNETAAQMIKEAAKLGVSIDTVKLGTKTILALKNDNDPKGADFGKLTARATKRTNKAVTLGWKKQKNADGYMIYGNVCGKKYKLLKTIKKKGTTSWTQKKLKKGTNYKYLVVAYKNVNGEKMPIAAAVVVHTNTKGGKVTVAKSLKLNKTKVTVKKGKSFTLKATEVKEDKNLKIKSHRKVKFESSNKKIAKVSSKGKITGVKKGTVTIFAYAQNGIYKTVKVTVK